MPKSRRGGRTSTPMLAIWGLVMLLLGAGIGFLFSGAGCNRKDHSRTESKDTPRKSTPATKSQEPPAAKPRAEEPKKEEPRKGESKQHEPEPKGELPRFALVIDDLGYAAPELVTRLCAQTIPFSVAVLPFQEFSKQSAEIAYGRGKEVMLHLPMEPIGYPGPSKDPGPGAVMYDLPESEMRLAVRKALEAVPHRKGVNNHMGSRITPDRKRMTWILEEIRASRCFFLDSRTEKDSLAFDIAEELKIPSVQRKVFLDDDKSFDEMAKQWERAIGIARKEGQVVIIGHVYPETIEALERLVPKTKSEVKFVTAGDLVK
jgi:polysaccharide deacetylase 2 family uncharacterized protein YibQ